MPKVNKIDVPRLKRGPMPGPPTRIPKGALKELGKSKKDKIGRIAQGQGGDQHQAVEQKGQVRPGPAGQGSGRRRRERAQWRQPPEEKEDAKPTLSADFIKNCARLRPGVKVHLDIYDEDLEAVVKLIACMTGKNIIISKPLKGEEDHHLLPHPGQRERGLPGLPLRAARQRPDHREAGAVHPHHRRQRLRQGAARSNERSGEDPHGDQHHLAPACRRPKRSARC